jgi:hypothetical protein
MKQKTLRLLGIALLLAAVNIYLYSENNKTSANSSVAADADSTRDPK